MKCIHCDTEVLGMECDKCKRPLCYDCAKYSSNEQPICADCKTAEGQKVNPMFWEMRFRYELMMLLFLVESHKKASMDPKTGMKRGQLPANINLN